MYSIYEDEKGYFVYLSSNGAVFGPSKRRLKLRLSDKQMLALRYSLHHLRPLREYDKKGGVLCRDMTGWTNGRQGGIYGPYLLTIDAKVQSVPETRIIEAYTF